MRLGWSGFWSPFTPDQQKATTGQTDILVRGRHQQNPRFASPAK